MKFTDVYSGYPGSVHDARVFRNSDLFLEANRDLESLFGNQEYIIGDKGYPLMNWCITPFTRRRILSEKQKFFNVRHASCRAVIEVHLLC